MSTEARNPPVRYNTVTGDVDTGIGAAVYNFPTLEVGGTQIFGVKNNSTTTDPTATDDEAAGYSVYSLWNNTSNSKMWMCTDATATAATWDHVNFVATGTVTSFNARDGVVVAVASDYDASQIDNDSSVSGTYVSDALNTLLSADLDPDKLSGDIINDNLVDFSILDIVLADLQTLVTNDFHNLGGTDDDNPDDDSEVPDAITINPINATTEGAIESVIELSDLQGAILDSQVPDNITIQSPIIIVDNATNTVRLALSGDRLFHDTNNDGVKDAGEEFIDETGTGSAWSDTVDADIIPDADGTRDLGANGTRFAEVYTDALYVTNNITVGGTIDGRDVATDGTKLDGVEAGADDVSTANINAAGAILETELTLEVDLETRITNVTNFFTNNDGALDDDDVSAADLSAASANIDTDGTIRWEDASDLSATGALLANTVADNEIDYTAVTLSDLTDDVGYVRLNGSTQLTASWDVGAFEVRAQTFQSDVPTGTAPLIVASTTVVTNLNADTVDGYSLDQAVTSGAAPTFDAANITGIPAGAYEAASIDVNDVSGLTGVDTNFVTGTSGTSGNLPQWNGDGDLVDSTVAASAVKLMGQWSDILADAAAWKPDPTTGPQITSADSDKHSVKAFSGVASETMRAKVFMPLSWDGGTMKLTIAWKATTGAAVGTDLVTFVVSGASVGNDEAWPPTTGVPITFSDTVIAVGDMHIVTSGLITITGAGPGEVVEFELYRDHDHVSDTMTEDLHFYTSLLHYKKATTEPAAP